MSDAPRATTSDALSAALPDSEKEKTVAHVDTKADSDDSRTGGQNETIRALIKATNERLLTEMVPCEHCCGRGYHHGFGEDGHDPDWCDVCGGAQYVGQDPEIILADYLRQAIALSAGLPLAGEAQGADAAPTLPDAETKELEALQLRYARLQSAAKQLIEAIANHNDSGPSADVDNALDTLAALVEIDRLQKEEKA